MSSPIVASTTTLWRSRAEAQIVHLYYCPGRLGHMKTCHKAPRNGAMRPYDKGTQAKTPMETFDLETLALLDALEADLDVDLDDEDEEEGGWDLFGWDGPDEDEA